MPTQACMHTTFTPSQYCRGEEDSSSSIYLDRLGQVAAPHHLHFAPYADIGLVIASLRDVQMDVYQQSPACRLLLAFSHSRWLLLTAIFGPVSLGLAFGSPAVLIAVKRYTKEVGMLYPAVPALVCLPSQDSCSLGKRGLAHTFASIVMHEPGLHTSRCCVTQKMDAT